MWALAYNILHHLGALPGGLGDAGGGTRWVDWSTLLTPYAVVGWAFAALRTAGSDRRSWTIALFGAALYVQGHGINVAANSISKARGDDAPTHLWDEVVGHWLWYSGVALRAVALACAVDTAARPAALALAVSTGVTLTTNALEGTTAVGSLMVAAALAAGDGADAPTATDGCCSQPSGPARHCSRRTACGTWAFRHRANSSRQLSV